MQLAVRRSYSVDRKGRTQEVIEVRGPQAAEKAMEMLFGPPPQGDKPH